MGIEIGALVLLTEILGWYADLLEQKVFPRKRDIDDKKKLESLQKRMRDTDSLWFLIFVSKESGSVSEATLEKYQARKLLGPENLYSLNIAKQLAQTPHDLGRNNAACRRWAEAAEIYGLIEFKGTKRKKIIALTRQGEEFVSLLNEKVDEVIKGAAND